jgi:hypothetical protein
MPLVPTNIYITHPEEVREFAISIVAYAHSLLQMQLETLSAKEIQEHLSGAHKLDTSHLAFPMSKKALLASFSSQI